ncbi:3-carboxy-cis,cis-muconate cycloisomerase [Nocardiopsis sp. CC223A]|uniref:3-carboxy-cis,cis-muconate cycloisomerase n=1 Tax=Nocardiopsis sp. CC223A TaxID=3044051 RepID=UPI00278C1286|nr:3-carboxy-cis,cis-muconate cycloisomerase [Nocardiopsis sp. CC223A]
MNPPTDTGLLSPVRAGTPVESLVSDRAWLQAMLDAEAALARSQARLGTVPETAAAEITRAARAEYFDLAAIAVSARENANPVVALVRELTRIVAERAPEAAEYVHRGSTSQDVFDTGAMLVSARALGAIGEDLSTAADHLAALARRHRDAPAVARTLALHAVPTTVGLRAAGWFRLVEDARARIARLLDGGLPVSLGGAAGTLAGYLEYASDQDHESPAAYTTALVGEFARETGLAAPTLPWHALRTPIADLAAVTAFTTGALGKIAVDVINLSRTEVAEVAEPGPPGHGASSAMPHKRNPVLATMVRSAALQVPALASGLTGCLLAEDERSGGAWHAEWVLLRECLRLTGGAAHTLVELVEGMDVDTVKAERNLGSTGSAVCAERVVAFLTPRLGRGPARRLLERCSAEAARDGRPLARVLAEEDELQDVPATALRTLCDPRDYTGAAAALVDAALGDR